MSFEQPPKDAMKVLAVDPGTARSGVVFAAVPGPPPGVDPENYRPRRIHIYGELFLQGVDAFEMAKQIKAMHGPTRFHAFIIDKKCSDQHPPGFDISIREHYSRAFESQGLSCATTGSDFTLGSPDVDGRELLLKNWMKPPDPIMRVHPNLVHLERQMGNFFRMKTNPVKRPSKGKIVLENIHCLEYIAAYFDRGYLFWVNPEPMTEDPDSDDQRAKKMLKDFQLSNWDMTEAAIRYKRRMKEPGFEKIDPIQIRQWRERRKRLLGG